MPEVLNNALGAAFAKLLGGTAPSGTVAFARCLSQDTIRELCSDANFQVLEWDVWGVSDKEDRPARLISADRAVEFREDKKNPMLLLVDVDSAGAGMDGIYSAAREITEAELFENAIGHVSRQLEPNHRVYAERAVRKARRLGNTRTLAPWRELAFYLALSSEVEQPGRALGRLGLWPIRSGDLPDDGELDFSARLVERLLLTRRTGATPEARVADLILLDASDKPLDTKDEQVRELERHVRAANSLSWYEATEALADKPDLWLNAIRPGVFLQTALRKIELFPWRVPPKKPAGWTGLQWVDEEERLYFYLSTQMLEKGKAPKLEIRWKTQPEDLPKGALEYKVSVLSGEDELASHTVDHSGKALQKTSFTLDDFEIEETATFEALVQIQPLIEELLPVSTEPFILTFGEVGQRVQATVAKPYRTLVEGMVNLKTKEAFEEACKRIVQPIVTDQDAKNFIGFRFEDTTAKVYRPALLQEVEEDWKNRQGTPGRWRVRVRADGSQAGPVSFIEAVPSGCAETDWSRVKATSKALCTYATSGKGLLGVVHCYTSYAADYVNAWSAALEAAAPELSLTHTVEVLSLSNQTLGLIVLPSHPLKVAWQQAYDQLVQYNRYEEGVKPDELRKTLEKFDSAYLPAFLPGLREGQTFVFGDTLNFHFTAMVPSIDQEPKATVALLAALLSKSGGEVTSSEGVTTAEALGREVRRYLELHSSYDVIRTHALRAGDAMTVTRALGSALKPPVLDDNEAEAVQERQQSFILELFPSKDHADVAGRFLLDAVERARSSGAALAEGDRWIAETYSRPGNVSLPKLKWARRSTDVPETPGHLTVVFDSFDSTVQVQAVTPDEKAVSLELYGLVVSIVRKFGFEPEPHWRSYVAPVIEGEKHPVARGLTDRLVKLHSTVLQAAARHLDGSRNNWPQRYTTIGIEQEKSLRRLHTLSDWVITVDKNAGVEYFDSPREKQNIYDAYVIDCVPEREDLGALQLVTSTSKFEEILNLLDTVLVEMGLSASPQNCQFLLDELKGLSGRLAIRLASQGAQAQEMIALGMVHHFCHSAAQHNTPWLSLQDGFFVPLDDVPGFQPLSEDSPNGMRRADLLYVTAKRGVGLQFSFVEVKFRRHLSTARSLQLVDTIGSQLRASRERFVDFFGDKKPVIQRALRRGWLARLLKFYADRGLRHLLSAEAHLKITRELDRMVREGKTYMLFSAAETMNDRGFVFCPEYGALQASRISSGTPEVWLFGSSERLELSLRVELMPTHEIDTAVYAEVELPKYAAHKEESITSTASENTPIAAPKLIKLGQEVVSLEPLHWPVSTAANPHLMIVGLPGMGKTTTIINICEQLVDNGVAPIVFSYHEDIDQKLEHRFSETLHKVGYDGLGFNPMQIVDQRPTAFIDNVGMLRDIFAAIFPDLGDVQLGKLRDALKQSYLDQGWGEMSKAHLLVPPEFRSFFDLLKTSPKPDNGLLLRLGELDDYGFFSSQHGATSLLDIPDISLINLHATQNENLQRAFAAFVLYNLYKNMFRRGLRSDITHAVVFDEAHRASRLKLLPTLAKESRKYGVSLLIASQEVKDFDSSLFSAVASYLVLRLGEKDAKEMAKRIGASDQQKQMTDYIKQIPRYQAFFYGEGFSRAKQINL